MIPDFSSIPFRPTSKGHRSLSEWERSFEMATGSRPDDQIWNTPEGIPVRPLYVTEDRDVLDFPDTYPGFSPYQRGPYPTMYVNQPWTIRQ